MAPSPVRNAKDADPRDDKQSRDQPSEHFALQHTYPIAPAPNDDVAAIRGNCSVAHKQWNVNALAYHFGEGGKHVFGYNETKNLKMIEMNVSRRQLEADVNGAEVIEGEVVCEIEVKEGMLNRHGTLAGACLAHIVDLTTFAAFFAIGLELNINPRGASNSMSFTWYSAAFPGSVIRIISTTINMNGRNISARAEVFDKNSGKLIASATHGVTTFGKSIQGGSRNAKL